VIFNTEGRVAMAEPFWSRAEAENFIEDLAADLPGFFGPRIS
jgi:hypothetical protein